jgi:hypothetical protein
MRRLVSHGFCTKFTLYYLAAQPAVAEQTSALATTNPTDLVNSNAKRRQYIGPPAMPLPVAPPGPLAAGMPELLAGKEALILSNLHK